MSDKKEWREAHDKSSALWEKHMDALDTFQDYAGEIAVRNKLIEFMEKDESDGRLYDGYYYDMQKVYEAATEEEKAKLRELGEEADMTLKVFQDAYATECGIIQRLKEEGKWK